MNCHRLFISCIGLSLLASVFSASTDGQTKPGVPRQTRQTAANRPAVQQKVDPNLVRVLTEWHNATKEIVKLEGRHNRFTYDYVFNVEKQATGEFFYRAPDAGRIDLSPATVKVKKAKKKHPVSGEEVLFSVQPDVRERWVCDGRRILVIDDLQKTVQHFNIPKEAQGANIMDGPLPFMFGMPPQKALARYQMKLLVANQRIYELFVQPKLAQDKANFKWARVQIERKSMLPVAVQMMDPTGKRETVYTFPDIKKNPRKALIPWMAQDPFNPKLKGYVVQAALPVVKEAGPSGKVPAIIGFNYKIAEQKLKQAGYKPEFVEGPAAINKDLIHHVANQTPKGRTALKAGSVVRVALFTPPAQQVGVKVPTVPKVAGLHYKDAEAKVKAAGFVPKYHRGRVALQEKDVLRVYEQTPPAGAILERGDQVHMTLFVKSAPAAKSSR